MSLGHFKAHFFHRTNDFQELRTGWETMTNQRWVQRKHMRKTCFHHVLARVHFCECSFLPP